MSDTNVPLHEYLQEVVGYLQTLGKNIQKRTQHLLDSKINDSYLNTPEKVKRTAEKIYSICSLSKASIDKVEEGIKRSVDSYVQKTLLESLNHDVSPTKESNERRKTKQQSHKEEEAQKTPTKRESDSNIVKDRSRRETSPKNSSNKTVDEKYNSPGKTFKNRHGIKFIKVKHQNRTLLIPSNINLKSYLKCSVGVVPFSYTKFELDSKKIAEDTRYNSNKSRTKSKHSRSLESSPQTHGLTRLTEGCAPESEDLKSDPRNSETPLKKSAADGLDEKNKDILRQDLKRKFKNICVPESDSDESDSDVFRRQTKSDKHSSKKGLSKNANSCSEPTDELSREEINNKLTKAEIGSSEILISGEQLTHQSCFSKAGANTDPINVKTKYSEEGDPQETDQIPREQTDEKEQSGVKSSKPNSKQISTTADKINKEDNKSDVSDQEEVNINHTAMSGDSIITDGTGQDGNGSDEADKVTLDVEIDTETQKPHQSWEDTIVDDLLTAAKIGAKKIDPRRCELEPENHVDAIPGIEQDANDLPTDENHIAPETDEVGEDSEKASELSEIITSKKRNLSLQSFSSVKTSSSITDKKLEAEENHDSPEMEEVREVSENTHAEKASTELSENIKAKSLSKKKNLSLQSSPRIKNMDNTMSDKKLEPEEDDIVLETDEVVEDLENPHVEKASTELSENIKAKSLSKKKKLSLQSPPGIKNMNNTMSDKKLEPEENDIVLETDEVVEDLENSHAEKTSAKLSKSVKNASLSKKKKTGLPSSRNENLDGAMSDQTLAKDNIETSPTTEENVMDSNKQTDQLTDNDLPTEPDSDDLPNDVEETSDSGSNKKSDEDEPPPTVAECDEQDSNQHEKDITGNSEEVTQDKLIEEEPTKKIQSDPENEDIDNRSTNLDEDKKDVAIDKVTEKPLIRCVNISNLLANNDVKDVPQALIPRARKIVTFVDDPIHIILDSPEKTVSTHVKNRPSILMKQKEKDLILSKSKQNNNKNKQKDSKNLQECDRNKQKDTKPKRKVTKIDISSGSDSDDSNSAKDIILKGIKCNILEGKSETWVNVVRDTFSWTTVGSLAQYGINTVYNESGEVCYEDSKNKKTELNKSAKKAVLNSSSSSDEGATKITGKRAPDNSGSSSLEEPGPGKSSPVEHKRKKKKFSKTKSQHKKRDLSDSENEIDSLLSLPKKRRGKSRKDSSGSSEGPKPNSGDEQTNEGVEMGRSLRLKGRTEQVASLPQSQKDRSESDASTASADKAGKDSKKSKEDNTLLDTIINGDLKTSDKGSSEHSSESGADSKSKSKVLSSEKPMERIKNDLLDDTSSSAHESTPKLNGKGKAAKAVKVAKEDSDEDMKQEKNDRHRSSSKNRSKDVIELDSESERSEDSNPKKSKKKSHRNGKDSDSADEAPAGNPEDDDEEVKNGDGKGLGSESDESEIFIPSKRKRQPKKSKSSGDSSDDSEDTGNSKKKRRRIKKMSGDESSGGGSDGSGSDAEKRKAGRKNIRALKKSSNLDSATRIAARKEKERVARIAERQKLYNESLFDESGKPDEVIKLDKVVLDFDPDTKEPSISVDQGLVEKLKPHQANGIKFMWDACFESEKQIKVKKEKGSGCILAHCMGLGKTLQVVTLVHTLLIHREKTKVERVLVVCPLSTVLNWVNEFKMWLEHAHSEEEINIFELSRFKQNYERAFQLKEWLEYGGVCILGYDMFRNLSQDNTKKFKRAQLNTFQQALVDPGPCLVVCDEGHLLKNEKTSISQSMNRVKSLRRIVLTGTPLQNNLKEYYCMVQFVKPDLLGKYNDYLNRFVNPITNGQYTNSTEQDIRVMKRRSHVLHKMLDGAVQRRDYAVLAPFLPPKHEYVLFISLTEIQVKLYAYYLENHSRRPNADRKTTPSLFADFQSLQRIWTHPLVLKANSERYELMQQKKRDKEEEDDSEGSLADFIDDEEETTTPQESSMSESDDSENSTSNKKNKSKKKGKSSKVKHKRVTRANAVKPEPDEEPEVLPELPDQPRSENPTEWWMSLCSEEELNDVRHSNKLVLLLEILKNCEAIGDKLLVFSQSLYSLDLIEQYLSKIDEATQKGEADDHLGGHLGSWSQGLDYFRLDGSTSCENRAIWCKAFNREDNPRARLFLISTRAGGLGINLVAANRVVIFDMSWNPSHDVQSIFRVYRFGQKKPCYIYRFLALGTMEEKIYERQVTKQAISKRVIDEQQIDRHYTESDLAELYIFCPEPEGPREVPKLPKDRLFADLMKQHDKVIYKFHEHDSLLENKEEETLTEEERKAAWDDYENEKTRPPPTLGGSNWLQGLQQQHQQQQMTMNALSAVLRQDYPSLSEQQIATMIPTILQQMYTNGDAALMQKMTSMLTTQGMMGGYKYPQNPMMAQGMMGMNPAAAMGVAGAGVAPGGAGLRGAPMYQQSWQQQQQMQLQRLQQQQALQANLKYYAGGLGSRDMIDMAALQQQQRALLLGGPGAAMPQRGRPPKGPPKVTQEVVDLDSE